MTLLQYFLVLKARWKVVLRTLFATTAIVMAVSFLLPKTYTATTSVLVDVRSTDPVAGATLGSVLQSPAMLQGYIATQIEIILSDRTARKVLKSLNLTQDPETREAWEKDTEGRGTLEDWVVEGLRKRIEAKPTRDANVISIKYSARDAKQAALVANAFAQSYLETDLDLKVEPARQTTAWFDERTKAVREKLDKAQARLSEFQRQKGIGSTDERLDVESLRLDELTKQLIAVQSAAAEAGAKQRQAGALPEVIQSPVVQQLRTDLARQEAKLREMASQLGTGHPQYQKMASEVSALRERVTLEMAQVAGSIGATSRVSQQREAQITAALDAQKQKVLALKQAREEAAPLIREVELAKREYDVVSQRVTQTRLESQANQTTITVLNPATEPVWPSNPKLGLNFALSMFVGTVLGIVFATLIERADRRIRDAADLSELSQLPVLGVLESLPATLQRQQSGGDIPRLPGANPAAVS